VLRGRDPARLDIDEGEPAITMDPTLVDGQAVDDLAEHGLHRITP